MFSSTFPPLTCPLMPGPVALCLEPVCTLGMSAGVGPLTSVYSVVHLQVSCAFTLLTANITFKYFSQQTLKLWTFCMKLFHLTSGLVPRTICLTIVEFIAINSTILKVQMELSVYCSIIYFKLKYIYVSNITKLFKMFGVFVNFFHALAFHAYFYCFDLWSIFHTGGTDMASRLCAFLCVFLDLSLSRLFFHNKDMLAGLLYFLRTIPVKQPYKLFFRFIERCFQTVYLSKWQIDQKSFKLSIQFWICGRNMVNSIHSGHCKQR